jgi:hypothetical protein
MEHVRASDTKSAVWYPQCQCLRDPLGGRGIHAHVLKMFDAAIDYR